MIFFRNFLSNIKKRETLFLFSFSFFIYLFCLFGTSFFTSKTLSNDLLYDFDYKELPANLTSIIAHPFDTLIFSPFSWSNQYPQFFRLILNAFIASSTNCIILKILNSLDINLKWIFTLIYTFSFSVLISNSVLDYYVFSAFTSSLFFYYICILKSQKILSYTHIFIISFLVWLNFGINSITIIYSIPLIVFLFRKNIKYYFYFFLFFMGISALGLYLQFIGKPQTSFIEYIINSEQKGTLLFIYGGDLAFTKLKLKFFFTETLLTPIYGLISSASIDAPYKDWTFLEKQNLASFLPYLIFITIPIFFFIKQAILKAHPKISKLSIQFIKSLLIILFLAIMCSIFYGRDGYSFIYSPNYIGYYIILLAFMYQYIPIKVAISTCICFLTFQIINNSIELYHIFKWINFMTSYSFLEQFTYSLGISFIVFILLLGISKLNIFQKNSEKNYTIFTILYLIIIILSAPVK